MNCRACLLMATIIGLCGCDHEDAAFSVGSGSYAQVTCADFNVDYRACYGPGWSEGVSRKRENYDFYTISIERADPDGSTVLFSKKFGANEVKRSVLDPNARNVVQVKGTTVTFSIQERPYVVDASKYMSSN